MGEFTTNPEHSKFVPSEISIDSVKKLVNEGIIPVRQRTLSEIAEDIASEMDVESTHSYNSIENATFGTEKVNLNFGKLIDGISNDQEELGEVFNENKKAIRQALSNRLAALVNNPYKEGEKRRIEEKIAQTLKDLESLESLG